MSFTLFTPPRPLPFVLFFFLSFLSFFFFFFSSRRRHTRCSRDWSSDVCSSDLDRLEGRLVRSLPPIDDDPGVPGSAHEAVAPPVGLVTRPAELPADLLHGLGDRKSVV